MLYLRGNAIDSLQAFWGKTIDTRLSTMQGGVGGQPWSDASAHTLLPIRGIRINFGGGIDRIQVGAIENSNELLLC